MNRFVFILLFLIVLLAPVQSHAFWLIYHKPAFHGKVIDAETKEPIEGAVVVVEYWKDDIISGPGGSYTSVVDVKEALTDKEGKFEIPSFTTVFNPWFHESYSKFLIYKPGYGSFPNYQVSPPTVGVDPEEFFSREKTGTEGEIEWKGIGKKFKVTFGVVELPKLTTWEERNKANMISSSGDISKSKWPLLYEVTQKEEEWLRANKGWRK